MLQLHHLKSKNANCVKQNRILHWNIHTLFANSEFLALLAKTKTSELQSNLLFSTVVTQIHEHTY